MSAPGRHPSIPLHVRVARSWWARARGLLGRRAPAPGTGLLIPGCRSIHTLGMRYPIDVLFVDESGCIRAIHSAVAPWRSLVYCRNARFTIEMAAGEAGKMQMCVGDRVQPIVEITDEL